MTDIVERLRIGRETCGVDMCRIREAKSGCTCAEAADEIERLRKALRPFAVAANALDRDGWDEGSIEGSLANVTAKHCRVARTALGEKE